MNTLKVVISDQKKMNEFSYMARICKLYSSCIIQLEYNSKIEFSRDIVFTSVHFSSKVLNKISFQEFSKWVTYAAEFEIVVVCESRTGIAAESAEWISTYVGDILVFEDEKPWKRDIDFSVLSKFDEDIIAALYSRHYSEFTLLEKIRSFTVTDTTILCNGKEICEWEDTHPIVWLSHITEEIKALSELISHSINLGQFANSSVYSMRDFVIYDFADVADLTRYKQTFLSRFLDLTATELLRLPADAYNLVMSNGFLPRSTVQEIFRQAGNRRE